jgi:hypothetical protein
MHLPVKIKPIIQRQNTNMRDAISAHEKLSCTLRFLASGVSYRDLAYSSGISASTISQIVPEVCKALYYTLKDECLCVPSSREQWLKIANEFQEKWQFPHCVGAIDGKHINIRAPPNTGSEYFNYKNHFSIVLLAVVDANAQFMAFQLGDAGSQSYGGIFKHGSLNTLCKSELFPQAGCLPATSLEVPYYLIGDEAFALDPASLGKTLVAAGHMPRPKFCARGGVGKVSNYIDMLPAGYPDNRDL